LRRPVNSYQTKWRHMPEECYLHSYTGRNLISFMAIHLYFNKTSFLNKICPAPRFFFGFTLQCSQWLLVDSTE